MVFILDNMCMPHDVCGRSSTQKNSFKIFIHWLKISNAIYIYIVVMKRAIAMHRAQKATQQLTTAAPTETKGPTATNVVDHWGGAIPPSVLVLVVLLWI